MRTVLLYTKEEIEKLASRITREQGGKDALLKTWELGVSNTEHPRLYVHYYHTNDGQGLHLTVVPLT